MGGGAGIVNSGLLRDNAADVVVDDGPDIADAADSEAKEAEPVVVAADAAAAVVVNILRRCACSANTAALVFKTAWRRFPCCCAAPLIHSDTSW